MRLGLTRLIGGVVVLLMIMVGTASATSITITAVYDSSTESSTPPTGFGFTLLPLGIGSPINHFQASSLANIDGISFTFAGGTPTISGEYAGNVTNSASPFGVINTNSNYFSAGGTTGLVSLTYPSAQTELDLLWGTVDTASGRNVLVAGSTTITGLDIKNAVTLAGFSFNDGVSDVYVEITGLPSFTTATFSDTNAPAFEFVPGVPGSAVPVPEPAALLLLGTGLIALGRTMRRRI
jgi:hypothetical protein